MLFLFSLCLTHHKEIIYADHAATTPCHPSIIKRMKPYWTLPYANAHSKHAFGLKAKKAIQQAQQHIAHLIQASPCEIIFTSGATEANYLALTGLIKASQKKHIITSVIEHKSILDVCKKLEKEGYSVTYIPVKKDGRICMDTLKKSITKDTGLISIMWVNNETGIIQPIDEIIDVCQRYKILFHTDASQALCRIPVHVQHIDAMSITAHKIYGPQGIGALYLKKNTPFASPYSFDTPRPGTLPTALCVGFGAACAIIETIPLPHDLMKTLIQALKQYGVMFNGEETHRIPDIVNIRFHQKIPHHFLKKVALSQGAACLKKPSYVLKAMGLNDAEIAMSFRLSLGRFITKEQVEHLITLLHHPS